MIDWLTDNIETIVAIAMVFPMVVYIPLEIHRSRKIRRRQIERNSIPCKHFVRAKIVDPILPMERSLKYEKPLEDILVAQRLGRVSGGGGTQMRKGGEIAWVDFEIELVNLNEALDLTCQRLRELGTPSGSVLDCRNGEKQFTVPIA